MKNAFVMLTVLCAANAFAMPTKNELGKAQSLVDELMTPIMDDFKAKKKTASEVADAAVKYAGEAETEAAKYILYRDSIIPYYARGEAYDKAADAVEQLKANVKDVPASVIGEIISKATIRANKEKAPRLFELYRQAKMQAAAEKDVKALRKKSASPANRRKLAEALATAGDWDAALKEFANMRDDVAPIAKKEQDGSGKSYELGEFWWAYEPAYENAEDTFRIHAVMHYRKALAAGEITGLKKPIVERRIKEFEGALGIASGAATAAAPAKGRVPTASDADVGNGTGGKGVASVTVKGKPIVVKLKTDVEIEFMPCPAGSFEMGYVENPRSPNYKHTVHITRPFWLGKYQVTRKQWSAFRDPGKVDDLIFALGGLDSVKDWVSYNDAMAFCEFLNKKHRMALPKGYVYRLPTEAEWEYACRANCSDSGDLYVRYANGQDADFGAVSVDKSDYDKASKANVGVKFGPFWSLPPMKSGMKLPNGWGLFDMVGNGREYTLDIYDVPEFCKRFGRNECDRLDALAYASNAKDPLHYVESDSKSLCSVTRSHSYCDNGTRKLLSRIHEGDVWWGTFRVCIGPDLVSEWKAKNGKK